MEYQEMRDLLDWLDGRGLVVTDWELLDESLASYGIKED